MNQIFGTTLKILRGGRFSALVALVALALLLTASGAQADGCANLNKAGAGAAPSAPFVRPQGDNHQVDEDSNGHASIVGLWHVNYTAETESGAPIFPPVPFAFAESLKTWHADGIEFEQAFFPPVGGNICFGVWKDLGDGHVKLHHIGIMFDATTGQVSNIFTQDEKDKVSADGKTYTGTLDFKLWPPSFAAVGVGTPIAEVTGTVSATRITVD
jgi:hypothetical protein